MRLILFILLVSVFPLKAQLPFDTLYINSYSENVMPYYTLDMPPKVKQKCEGKNIMLVGFTHRSTHHYMQWMDTSSVWVKYRKDTTSWDHWEFSAWKVALQNTNSNSWRVIYRRSRLDKLQVEEFPEYFGKGCDYEATMIEMPYENKEECAGKKCLFLGYNKFIDMRWEREYYDSTFGTPAYVSRQLDPWDHYNFTVVKAMIWSDKLKVWKVVYRRRNED